MALPPSGAISTDQIMNELAIPIQPRDWPSLWSLALANTTPKNKANAGGPYVLPNDWWGYSNIPPFFNANTTFTSASQACINPLNVQAYTNGSQYFYDAAMTLPIDSQGQYWNFQNLAIKTSFDGQSTGAVPCE